MYSVVTASPNRADIKAILSVLVKSSHEKKFIARFTMLFICRVA